MEKVTNKPMEEVIDLMNQVQDVLGSLNQNHNYDLPQVFL